MATWATVASLCGSEGLDKLELLTSCVTKNNQPFVYHRNGPNSSDSSPGSITWLDEAPPPPGEGACLGEKDAEHAKTLTALIQMIHFDMSRMYRYEKLYIYKEENIMYVYDLGFWPEIYILAVKMYAKHTFQLLK